MKQKQIRELKEKLRETANKYGCAGLLNLETQLLEVYEESKPETRNQNIVKAILQSNLIQLDREKQEKLMCLWNNL